MHKGKNPLKVNIVSFDNLGAEKLFNSALKIDNEDLAYLDLPLDLFTLYSESDTTPSTLDEALHSPNTKEWQAVYDYEISQLIKMNIFIIEGLPPGEKAILYSLVLKEKLNAAWDIELYWVRLVVGGHKQTKRVNYKKTFSSTAKSPAVHVVLGHAASEDWEIDQVDIKSTYLYTPLKEKIYRKPPHGILKPGDEGKVVQLVKCLYGLKQVGRGWYKEMSHIFINKLGFKQSALDHSIFYRHSKDEHTIVAIAMDDMALTSKNCVDIIKLKMSCIAIGLYLILGNFSGTWDSKFNKIKLPKQYLSIRLHILSKWW
jgi:hypothetical protein